MDETVANQWTAFFGIMLIVLVIIVMLVFTISFEVVVKQLVVEPLERASLILRKSADNMLISMRSLKKEFGGKSKFLGVEEDVESDPSVVLEAIVEKGKTSIIVVVLLSSAVPILYLVWNYDIAIAFNT
jgi:hypothetical protein